MRTSSSPRNSASSGGAYLLPWCSIPLDWPYERVVVEVEVAALRQATVIEWVVARILDEPEAETPTLAEAAADLGIMDSAFLREALQNLLQSGAVELRESSGPLDLPNCRLTDIGYRLLKEQQTSAFCERQGLNLNFDAITGEHLLRPHAKPRSVPKRPVVPGREVPARLRDIGLDRARELAKRQDEMFCQGDVQVQAVTVRWKEGFHFWLPVRLGLAIDRSGVLVPMLEGGTDAQRSWFDQNRERLRVLSRLDSISTRYWANGRAGMARPVIRVESWLPTVERLVTPEATPGAACKLIDAAQEEVILHNGWLDSPDVDAAILKATRRGVRCQACGAELPKPLLRNDTGNASGQLQAAPGLHVHKPLAIVADRSGGLSVERVLVRTPSRKTATIEVTAYIKHANLLSLRERLLNNPGDHAIEAELRGVFESEPDLSFERPRRTTRAESKHDAMHPQPATIDRHT